MSHNPVSGIANDHDAKGPARRLEPEESPGTLTFLAVILLVAFPAMIAVGLYDVAYDRIARVEQTAREHMGLCLAAGLTEHYCLLRVFEDERVNLSGEN